MITQRQTLILGGTAVVAFLLLRQSPGGMRARRATVPNPRLMPSQTGAQTGTRTTNMATQGGTAQTPRVPNSGIGTAPQVRAAAVASGIVTGIATALQRIFQPRTPTTARTPPIAPTSGRGTPPSASGPSPGAGTYPSTRPGTPTRGGTAGVTPRQPFTPPGTALPPETLPTIGAPTYYEPIASSFDLSAIGQQIGYEPAPIIEPPLEPFDPAMFGAPLPMENAPVVDENGVLFYDEPAVELIRTDIPWGEWGSEIGFEPDPWGLPASEPLDWGSIGTPIGFEPDPWSLPLVGGGGASSADEYFW